MPKYAIARPKRIRVPIAGSKQYFPVRRIYCVGQNYAKHIAEMGGPNTAKDRKPPFFFQKPRDAIVNCGPNQNKQIAYPKLTDNLHHEVEMVLAIGVGGEFIDAENAHGHIFGLAVGVDLTRRDRQAEMKAAGRSWEIAKAFDNSAPISNIVPMATIPTHAKISLQVDGDAKQDSDINQMIWNPSEIVATLSTHYELFPGDLIFSGTPEGVGPIVRGQTVSATLEDVATLTFTMIE